MHNPIALAEIKQMSPNAYTFKFEMAGDDGSWNTVVEGKSTRAVAAKK